MAAFPQFAQLPTAPGIPASQLLTPSSKSISSNGSGGLESPTRPTPLAPPPQALSVPASVGSPYSAAAAQYSSAASLLAGYTRLPGLTEGMYGAAGLTAPGQAAAAGLYTFGADPAAFYVNPLTGTPYDIKENAEIWRNLSQPAAWPYDPATLAAYPYGYGGMDFSLAARRKNATKENTSTLKAWLQEHKKNPYPTKGEKIMLAIITKMTLTQVSTWFANARRRLKKENKVTWSPRNKDDSDDEGDRDGDVSRDDISTNREDESSRLHNSIGDGDDAVDVTGLDSDVEDDDDGLGRRSPISPHEHPAQLALPIPHSSQNHLPSAFGDRLASPSNHNNNVKSPSSSASSPAHTPPPHSPASLHQTSTSSPTHSDAPKPRIWSLADVLGPTTSSSSSSSTNGLDSRVTSAAHPHGLPFPMPLKPSGAAGPIYGHHHPHGTGPSGFRHWGERAPYPLPGIPHSFAAAGLPGPVRTSMINGMAMSTMPRPTMGSPTEGTPLPAHINIPSSVGSRVREAGEIDSRDSRETSSRSSSSVPSVTPDPVQGLTAFKPVSMRSKFPDGLKA